MNARKITEGCVITSNTVIPETPYSPPSYRIKSVETYESFQKKVKIARIIVAAIFFTSWIWIVPLIDLVVHQGNSLKVFISTL